MIVVVAIIGLLLAIAVPVSTGLLNSQKAKATLMTMQTLEAAIDTYANERPIVDKTSGKLNGHGYTNIYGAFPPSPVTSFSLDSRPSNQPEFKAWGPSGFDNGQEQFAINPGTKKKLEILVRGYLAPNVNLPEWHYNGDSSWFETPVPATDKYMSIETLVLFLKQLSPQALRSIDRLQKYVTNKDLDLIAWDSDGQKPYDASLSNPELTTLTDLEEVTDAWGNPLRYAVQSPVQTSGGKLKIRWELRSAGPDGKFEPTFTLVAPNGPALDGSFASEEDAGDDVILRGP